MSWRGFASLSPEKRREIARLGGIATQAKGVGHRYSSAEAVAAGKKGGIATSSDREHMSAIGQKGGLKTSLNREHMRMIGKRGGQAVAQNREHMREIGAKGQQAKVSLQK